MSTFDSTKTRLADPKKPEIHTPILPEISGSLLLEHCGDAMQHFGGSAVHEIEQSLEQVHQTIQLRDRRQVEGRLSIVNNVMACLPGPSAY